MTAYDDLKPTVGDNVNSFEWMYDVNTGTAEAPVWTNIPDITGLDPKPSPTMQEDTTYANKGNKSQSKLGEDLSIDFQVKPVTDIAGIVQPALELLLVKADLKGADNVVGYRYYSARIASLAYQGTATVNWSRANTGNVDTEFFSFSMVGKGDRVKIANPEFAVPAVPTISAATPTGASAGDIIKIAGTGFSGLSGAAAVKVGAVNATSYEQIGSTKIYAVVPAGTSGSAPVTVTNAAGASPPFAYTRA